MFQSFRQRATSPQPPPHETPRVVPSIRLTTATPVTATLAPKQDSNTAATTGSGSRRVVPKKTLVLHQAPPPLPLPPRRSIHPVKDHDGAQDGGIIRPQSRTASPFGSSGTTTIIIKAKIKVFVELPATATVSSSSRGTYATAAPCQEEETTRSIRSHQVGARGSDERNQGFY